MELQFTFYLGLHRNRYKAALSAYSMALWKKRGDLTSMQLIPLILIILAFSILIVFLVRLGLDSYASNEACKLSVLGRGSAGDSAQSFLPLKCTTTKTCLSSDKGKCDEVFAGEKEVKTISLPSNNDQAAELIAKESALALYDCWNTMGRGKIDLFGDLKSQIGVDVTKPTCVICSRVAVDEDVDPDVLALVNINEYLRTHKVPGTDLTYLQSFTDRSIQSYAEVKEDALAGFEKTEFSVIGANDRTTNNLNREMAIVFMQAKSVAISDVLTKMGTVGGIVVGATFTTPIVRTVASRVVFTPAGAIAAVVGVAGIGGFGAYNAYQGQLIAAGYCGKFESRTDKASEGCSLVQGINYNAKDINALCPSIQGDP